MKKEAFQRLFETLLCLHDVSHDEKTTVEQIKMTRVIAAEMFDPIMRQKVK